MQYNMFCVGSDPYCLWDKNIEERNMEFLNAIDHGYFEYVARINSEHLEAEDKQRAAITIRTTYHHGLETLFALLCASLQAPDCVYAWIQKYLPRHLRDLLRKINTNQVDIIHKYRVEQVSWDIISERIHKGSNIDSARAKETGRLFSQLWRRLASEYLQEDNRNEYNQIKHGFRARPGGFGMAVGLEEEYGVPAPEENMQMLTQSEFGTSFLTQDKVLNSPHKKDWHFTTRYHAINWNPEAMVYALFLISMSINNILSYLKILNGARADSVRFTRPQESELFQKPWQVSTPGVTTFSWGINLAEDHITRFSKQEILDTIEKSMERGRTKSLAANHANEA